MEIEFYVFRVDVSGNYAYLLNSFGDLVVVDITDVGSAYVLITLDLPIPDPRSIVADDGLVYAVLAGGGIYIIDVSLPGSPVVMTTVSSWNVISDLYITDEYGFAADDFSGLMVIDIDPLEWAYVANTLNPGINTQGVSTFPGHLCAVDSSGITIYNTTDPQLPSVLKTVPSPQAWEVVNSDGYAYVTDYDAGLYIYDIDPPEYAHFVNLASTPGHPQDIAVDGDYIYIADSEGGLRIFKVEY